MTRDTEGDVITCLHDPRIVGVRVVAFDEKIGAVGLGLMDLDNFAVDYDPIRMTQWPPGATIQVRFDADISDVVRGHIMAAGQQWVTAGQKELKERMPTLSDPETFDPTKSECDVRIGKVAVSSPSTVVGTSARRLQMAYDGPTMRLSSDQIKKWETQAPEDKELRGLLHEWGHVFGMPHTHQLPLEILDGRRWEMEKVIEQHGLDGLEEIVKTYFGVKPKLVRHYVYKLLGHNLHRWSTPVRPGDRLMAIRKLRANKCYPKKSVMGFRFESDALVSIDSTPREPIEGDPQPAIAPFDVDMLQVLYA